VIRKRKSGFCIAPNGRDIIGEHVQIDETNPKTLLGFQQECPNKALSQPFSPAFYLPHQNSGQPYRVEILRNDFAECKGGTVLTQPDIKFTVRVLFLVNQELFFGEGINERGARILKQDILIRNPGVQYGKISAIVWYQHLHGRLLTHPV
jgi:hypothetical protein